MQFVVFPPSDEAMPVRMLQFVLLSGAFELFDCLLEVILDVFALPLLFLLFCLEHPVEGCLLGECKGA